MDANAPWAHAARRDPRFIAALERREKALEGLRTMGPEDTLSPTLTILGNKVTVPTKNLEWFAAPKGTTEVTFSTSECTSMCPITGQPDFQKVTITYTPDGRCLESKSLKLYLQTFRNEGMFCEALAATIARDVARAIQPAWIRVTVEQNPRGGIALKAASELFGDEEDDDDGNS